MPRLAESGVLAENADHHQCRQTPCQAPDVEQEPAPPGMSQSLVKFIDLPVVSDPRGNLSFAESGVHVPFDIERVYYLYEVPSGSTRAGHAHRVLHQLLIAVSGSFDVRLNDGRREEVVTLNRPGRGLHIGPGTWRELENFSSGSVCLVLASTPYDESDYIRDFDDFQAYATR